MSLARLSASGSLRGSPSGSPLFLRLELIRRGQIHNARSLVAHRSVTSPQCRSLQTTSRTLVNKNNTNKKFSPQAQPVPLSQIPRLILGAAVENLRGLKRNFRNGTFKTMLRQNPEELVFALVLLAALAVVMVYIVRVYFTYFYSEQFTKYPPPIAKALRRALYYSNYNPDQQMALKYWKQALELCDELHLDTFSDDVMGIKIELAAWLEKIGSYDNAVKVLENLSGDCKRWVDLMEKSIKEGGKIPPSLLPPVVPQDPAEQPAAAKESKQGETPETIWGRRTRILGKAVGINVKLANLYSFYLAKPEEAHERLIWSVETALNELRRRTVEGLKEGEGKWMSSEEIGGALESLGHSYEAKSQFHLALPLFFQALRLSQHQCHSATIMNNIAACFAQHPIMPAGQSQVDTLMGEEVASATPAQKRTAYLEAAKRWAKNARQHANEPKGDDRTPECNQACATSLCNLASIARLTGNVTEARRLFEKAIEMSRSLEFEEGVTQAEDGLRALSASS
ncbi:hypothetical protein QR685DRAFT_72244 [Neurospora intermedia]|uniref:TPR domain-containing protein n=1 Tax=Neurospora intermedia TaxID=5142 RepID=A0ABR3DU58_NEUIN